MSSTQTQIRLNYGSELLCSVHRQEHTFRNIFSYKSADSWAERSCHPGKITEEDSSSCLLSQIASNNKKLGGKWQNHRHAIKQLEKAVKSVNFIVKSQFCGSRSSWRDCSFSGLNRLNQCVWRSQEHRWSGGRLGLRTDGWDIPAALGCKNSNLWFSSEICLMSSEGSVCVGALSMDHTRCLLCLVHSEQNPPRTKRMWESDLPGDETGASGRVTVFSRRVQTRTTSILVVLFNVHGVKNFET